MSNQENDKFNESKYEAEAEEFYLEAKRQAEFEAKLDKQVAAINKSTEEIARLDRIAKRKADSKRLHNLIYGKQEPSNHVWHPVTLKVDPYKGWDARDENGNKWTGD